MNTSKISSKHSTEVALPVYTVGIATIGAQSCIPTNIASPFLQVQTSAAIVTYRGSLSASVQSLTFQHYFVSAAALCTHYLGPVGMAACQTLANLCALQMFDVTSQACVAHLAVVNNRASSGYNNGVNNWVIGNPWLFFTLPPATGASASLCFSNVYQAYLYLLNYNFEFTVAAYTMNGTFAGYINVATFFTYCGRSPPYTDQGGGTSSSTKYQLLGYSTNTNYSCELNSLLNQQQLFYELYLYDRKSDASVPVPVRIVNL